MSSFDELRKFLIPPERPVSTGTPQQWDALEGRLGMRLPHDYKAFVMTYGHGSPNRWFNVINPFCGFAHRGDLESKLAVHRQVYRETYNQADYDRFSEGLEGPVPEGLVPWATGGDGGTSLWDTRPGHPDRWTVMEEREDYWPHFPGTMVDYLIEAVTGRYESIVYGPTPKKRRAYGYEVALPVVYQPFTPQP